MDLTYDSLAITVWNSPFPKPASAMASAIASALKGTVGEGLKRIELPMIIGGIADLKGSQNGKFQGLITAAKKTIG